MCAIFLRPLKRADYLMATIPPRLPPRRAKRRRVGDPAAPGAKIFRRLRRLDLRPADVYVAVLRTALGP